MPVDNLRMVASVQTPVVSRLRRRGAIGLIGKLSRCGVYDRLKADVLCLIQTADSGAISGLPNRVVNFRNQFQSWTQVPAFVPVLQSPCPELRFRSDRQL